MTCKNERLEVKSYWSPDIESLWGWEPEDNSVFYLLEMNIGIKGEAASDVYSVIVATPEGISRLRERGGRSVFSGIHKVLLLDFYRWEDVRKLIEGKLSGIKNVDALSSANELMVFFNWEYE